MRYVAELIPGESKVLPDYFKGQSYKEPKKNPQRNVLKWIVGIHFSIAALAFLPHLFSSLLLGLVALLVLPPGARFLERKLRCKLTTPVKAVTAGILLIISMPLCAHYVDVDNQEARELTQRKEKEEKIKKIAEQRAQQRRDSLNILIQQGEQFFIAGNYSKAKERVSFAASLTGTEEDRSRLEQTKRKIAVAEVLNAGKSGNYQQSLVKIDSLLALDAGNSELLYGRAVCYSKTGKVAEAVADLKTLMEKDHADAKALYEKINPIRKRVSGYCTRCWDGSVSYSSGRGTCSHHGGVKNWNEPIYDEYRQY